MCLHLPMHSRNISKWWHCLVCCRFANLIDVVVFRRWSSEVRLCKVDPTCHLRALQGATSPTQTKAVWVRQLQKDWQELHTLVHSSSEDSLVNARFGLGQSILNAPHPKFKISASEKEGMNWFDWAFVVHNIGWGCSRDADCGQARYAK